MNLLLVIKCACGQHIFLESLFVKVYTIVLDGVGVKLRTMNIPGELFVTGYLHKIFTCSTDRHNKTLCRNALKSAEADLCFTTECSQKSRLSFFGSGTMP